MGFFAERVAGGSRRSFRLLWHKIKILGLCGAGLAAACGAGVILWKSGSFAKMAERLQEDAANAGFRVMEVTVSGRSHAAQDDILARTNVRSGMPIFAVDLGAARKNLIGLSWVKDAVVSRRLPDKISVNIIERTPAALWNRGGKMFLIDAEGVTLAPVAPDEGRELPLVSGEGAPKRAAELLSLLKAEPALDAMMSSAAFVGARRWDLHLKNGMIVMLPEKESGLALARLSRAQAEHGILDKNVRRIDLRLPDRLVMEPGSPGNT